MEEESDNGRSAEKSCSDDSSGTSAPPVSENEQLSHRSSVENIDQQDSVEVQRRLNEEETGELQFQSTLSPRQAILSLPPSSICASQVSLSSDPVDLSKICHAIPSTSHDLTSTNHDLPSFSSGDSSPELPIARLNLSGIISSSPDSSINGDLDNFITSSSFNTATSPATLRLPENENVLEIPSLGSKHIIYPSQSPLSLHFRNFLINTKKLDQDDTATITQVRPKPLWALTPSPLAGDTWYAFIKSKPLGRSFTILAKQSVVAHSSGLTANFRAEEHPMPSSSSSLNDSHDSGAQYTVLTDSYDTEDHSTTGYDQSSGAHANIAEDAHGSIRDDVDIVDHEWSIDRLEDGWVKMIYDITKYKHEQYPIPLTSLEKSTLFTCINKGKQKLDRLLYRTLDATDTSFLSSNYFEQEIVKVHQEFRKHVGVYMVTSHDHKKRSLISLLDYINKWINMGLERALVSRCNIILDMDNGDHAVDYPTFVCVAILEEALIYMQNYPHL